MVNDWMQRSGQEKEQKDAQERGKVSERNKEKDGSAVQLNSCLWCLQVQTSGRALELQTKAQALHVFQGDERININCIRENGQDCVEVRTGEDERKGLIPRAGSCTEGQRESPGKR